MRMPSLIDIAGAMCLPLVCIRTCILARKLTPLTPGGTGQGKAPGNPPCISSFKVEGLAAVGCATPNTPQALAHVSAPVRVRRAPPWPSPGAPCFRDVGNRGGHQSHLCPRSARSCCSFACGARAHDSGERVRRSASSAGSAEGSPQETARAPVHARRGLSRSEELDPGARRIRTRRRLSQEAAAWAGAYLGGRLTPLLQV